MIVMDGKKLSEKRLEILREKISALKDRKPGLAVVQVGKNPASNIYVGKKIKACQQVGIVSVERLFTEKITEEELIEAIHELNREDAVDGILVQLPLPKHISEAKILNAVSPEKDVDGFHPMNLGRLAIGEPTFIACTPKGMMSLLEEYKIPLKGKRACVLGRSRIVGRPIALLLDRAGATVTVLHSQTPGDPAQYLREADIVVAAIGKPEWVKGEWLKEGAVVLDVGINRLESGKLVGDVHYESACKRASAITPVPGGVGPMTICSLLENTFLSFERREAAKRE